MEKTVFSNQQKILSGLLKTLRERAGLRQVDLAERLGVSQAIVSNIERGERRLDVLELRQVCEKLGVRLPDFINRLEEELGTTDRRP